MSRRERPARTVEEREHQMINLSFELAERKLKDGTASSQIIAHFLDLGSSKARLEKERLENENELLREKVKTYEAAREEKQSYEKVLEAIKIYSGVDEDDEEL